MDGAELGAAVGVAANGEVAFVRVSLTRGGATRNLARAEVESLLRALEAGQQAPALQAAGWSHPAHRAEAVAGAALLSGLAGAGLVGLRRGLKKQRD